MCGDTGVSSRQRWRGDTIGPRAEKEYAVEPVGVATITPSAAYVVKNGAVDLDVEADEPAGVHLLEHRLVEREPRAARGPSDSTVISSTMRSMTS